MPQEQCEATALTWPCHGGSRSGDGPCLRTFSAAALTQKHLYKQAHRHTDRSSYIHAAPRTSKNIARGGVYVLTPVCKPQHQATAAPQVQQLLALRRRSSLCRLAGERGAPCMKEAHDGVRSFVGKRRVRLLVPSSKKRPREK